ncbi:hypothetical protein P153DRAFT_423552 [Dothidotthia symphoricarpi CBS 119687]|uniref:S-adenosyl-L-methionine-dependent methyltransferase n=1 Tax=Dothidotthia symphoricarpi CBS 119687 TaxID=1392245 RepID=A0A6A6ABS3_9PLEO|nr:uncharacterized protein P153DRAFT_423552 [Dothidotthia symphoricarpi CBS 119687]KAF2128297.1 hypothetical protein P153DRAFT_423552 [Dothidotthia symphoricarpi CBS 119687]
MASITTLSKSGTNDDNVIFTANESEVARLDKQHRIVLSAMPTQVLAPIDLNTGGLRILDQATGSGIWLRDLRDTITPHIPNAYVGTDIETSYFPSATSIPSDMSYSSQSMTASWPTEWQNSFDLVHSRFALPGIGTHPLADVVNNLIALVKPGGWIQFVEMEWESWDFGVAGQQLHHATKQLFATVSNGQGVDLRVKLSSLLKDAGLIDIGEKVVGIQVGKSAKEVVREMSQEIMFATASGVVDTLGKLGLGKDDLDSMPGRLIEEIRERGGEWKACVVWAQKPC